MKLVVASTNLHKVREIRTILKTYSYLDVFSLKDFPSYTPVEESGETFEANARLKALHAAQTLGLFALADDSGLVVPALGNRPGVFSARYAGPNRSDKENRKKLIEEMKHLEGIDRAAYYECCMALASPEQIERVTHGMCEGMIATQERGGLGFGYDPLFQKEGYRKTFGELTEEVKTRISHRTKALEKMALVFATWQPSATSS